MLPPNIHSAIDLQTTRLETVKGFVAQALVKTDKANPHLAEAQRLATALEPLLNINDVLSVPSIQAALVAASGISDKARGYLSEPEMLSSVAAVLKAIAANNPTGWKDELVYRFLLTRGDTLGGSMRNYIGAEAAKRLSAAVVGSLNQRGLRHMITHSKTGKITALEWPSRLLVFDKKPKFINNNIDAILLDTTKIIPGTVALENPVAYIACGELKGGNDPGGADEHYKTAVEALRRVGGRFAGGVPPHIFFVGGAIEAVMAGQIFDQLQSGILEYAANLTAPQQLADLTNWLVSL